MAQLELPPGRYLSCALQVVPDAAGQTRALLLRNRLFARAGVRPDVLTLGAAPDHEERRRVLRERRLLSDGVGMLNIYEHYLEHGWGDQAPTGEGLADLSPYKLAEQNRPDGSPWRVLYRPPGKRTVYDYLRADGSPYLRTPAFNLRGGGRGRGTIQQVDEQGAVVGEMASAGQWFRRWILELAEGHDRTFVFMDSRFVVPHVVPIRRRRVHLVYVMHNLHVIAPHRWDSAMPKAYERVLRRIGGMDAMVTLTARQRDDIAQRRGATSNMFVVPNPVDLPEPPATPAERDPHRVVIVARLEPQKGLVHAIAAFEQVVAAVPDARLDLYGDGTQRERLEQQVVRRGLSGNVTVHGFRPQAADELWTASAFVMTSRYEGYPLATLESMSRGCPVVAYDIKYGPREQITDGEDGFLVPPGDVDGLARRLIELLRSPETVARMSAAARATASRFGPAEFVARWAGVLEAVVAQGPRRTRIDDARVDVKVLRIVRRNRLRFDGVVRIDGRGKAKLSSAEIALHAIDPDTAEVTQLPVKAKLVHGAFHVRTPAGLLGGGARVPEGARLRLRVTWQNSAWETELAAQASVPKVAA